MESLSKETTFLYSAEAGSLQPTIAEAARYLGIRKEPIDASIEQELKGCCAELEEQILPRAVWAVYSLSVGNAGSGAEEEKKAVQESAPLTIGFADMQVQSRSLARNLAGCDAVVLMAATLGPGPDRLIARAQVAEIGKAVMLQASATAYIEAFCDRLAEEIAERVRPEGYYLRPRFSPGYGDFPLELQSSLLDRLVATKTIGVHLTDSLLMMPSKSVTAVIGLSKENTRCVPQGCEACAKTDCLFRRDTGA